MKDSSSVMIRPPARILHHTPLFIPLCRRTSPVRGRRGLSFASPAKRSRSWKNAAVRWALALGAVYIYNTSDVFAEVPTYHVTSGSSNQDDESLQTIDDIVAKRQQAATADGQRGPATPQEYEEEAGNEGAFNPETGEINWDCPCLGGMAHGPCGEEFKAAFSCFVYSKEEPKGMDCIDRFKGMQDCFRRYPEVYGAELDDDDDEDEDRAHDLDEKASTTPTEGSQGVPSTPAETPVPPPNSLQPLDGGGGGQQGTEGDAQQALGPANVMDAEGERKQEIPEPTPPHRESGERGLAPKAWHDEKRDERKE